MIAKALVTATVVAVFVIVLPAPPGQAVDASITINVTESTGEPSLDACAFAYGLPSTFLDVWCDNANAQQTDL